MAKVSKNFISSKDRQVERLRGLDNWFPITALIPFGLCFILTGVVLVNLNTRIGNPSEVMEYPAEPPVDDGIWFAVKVIDKNVVVTTDNRKVFKWPAKLASVAPMADFVAYLKERVRHEIFFGVLGKEKMLSQVTAVISADQNLKYVHVRPIIRALAEAGINNYAFETRANHLAHK